MTVKDLLDSVQDCKISAIVLGSDQNDRGRQYEISEVRAMPHTVILYFRKTRPSDLRAQSEPLP